MNRLVALVTFAVLIYGVSGSPTQRIVGGTAARADQIQATVSLLRHVPNTLLYNFHCAGALVYPHIVLSAAQCFNNMYLHPVSWRVRAGSIFHASGGVLINAVGIRRHPDFIEGTQENDIALVNLGSPVTAIDTAIAPLPESAELPNIGSYSEIAGWGAILSTDPTTATSLTLQVASVTVSDRDTCVENLELVGFEVQVDHFCTTGSGVGICHNDIGSPLYQGGRLVGVASYHMGCGFDAFPDVYTATGPFIAWVEENVTG